MKAYEYYKEYSLVSFCIQGRRGNRGMPGPPGETGDTGPVGPVGPKVYSLHSSCVTVNVP